MDIFYHVAGEQWQAGDDLLCWDRLEAAGIAVDWKWGDAPAGFDGSVVCLFESLDEAQEYQSEYGGTIVAVNVPVVMPEMVPAVMGGYIHPRRTTVDEGYTAILDGIPADWLSIVG